MARTISRRSLLAGAALTVAAAACGGRTARDGADPAAPEETGASTTSAPTTSTPGHRPEVTAGEPARFVPSGSAGRPEVALTFHTNGDLGLAVKLLDLLAARRVPITAFVVGNWLDEHPEWAQRLASAGHELANHTYTHPNFASLGASAMASEITRCRDTLVRLTGSGGTFFRPSGTENGTEAPPAAVLRAAAQAGYPVVLGFDVDPLDYKDPGAPAVTSRLLGALGPGSIVSLHFGHPGTISALPAVLDGIAARGLTPVTASKLLGFV
jgi:peptidoglycan/xylan/chitin deacetylase (PgdA/CDA1 family)